MFVMNRVYMKGIFVIGLCTSKIAFQYWYLTVVISTFSLSFYFLTKALGALLQLVFAKSGRGLHKLFKVQCLNENETKFIWSHFSSPPSLPKWKPIKHDILCAHMILMPMTYQCVSSKLLVIGNHFDNIFLQVSQSVGHSNAPNAWNTVMGKV